MGFGFRLLGMALRNEGDETRMEMLTLRLDRVALFLPTEPNPWF